MKYHYDEKFKFHEIFNPKNGLYIRSGVIENGIDTGNNPFMRSFPGLLDVGIMGNCLNGRSGLCTVQCYQNGPSSSTSNMSLHTYRKILDQSKGKVFQCLREDELIVVKHNNFSQIKSLKDIIIGDLIYTGNSFASVTEINSKVVDSFVRIKTSGGFVIDTTSEHKFPTNNGLKKVSELIIGDKLLRNNHNQGLNKITELDLVKIILQSDLGKKYSIYGEVINQLIIKHKLKFIYNYEKKRRSLWIEDLKPYLSELNYQDCYITKERSQYNLQAVYPITNDLMKLLGHYIGNGSKRTYVIATKQEKMISEIHRILGVIFPQFLYNTTTTEEKTIIELHSKILHEDLFDLFLGCRTFDKEKQLPNFILNVDYEKQIAFLSGYICDGNLNIVTSDGLYGSIVFNTSSNKLYKDLSLLFSFMNLKFSIQSAPATKGFYKKENRTINRKRRFRINFSNKIEISKIIDCVKDHYNVDKFIEAAVIKGIKYSRYNIDINEIISIEFIEKPINVVDINIDSDDRLFITSNGFISHNCALGGKGDPNLHENFAEILAYTHNSGIVPNYTSSGITMTERHVALTKSFCGSAAISDYRNEWTGRAIKMLLDAGVKTNLHFVLGNDSIDRAIQGLNDNFFYDERLNAVVFLLHKPVGLGTQENILKQGDPKVAHFFSLIEDKKYSFRVGFDSCTIPGLLNNTSKLSSKTMDTCEGGRFSAYITPDNKMIPCSFDNQDLKWAVDLDTYSIEEAWNSEAFNSFRNSLKYSCPDCSIREECMGGCPIRPEIVLCNKNEKSQL